MATSTAEYGGVILDTVTCNARASETLQAVVAAQILAQAREILTHAAGFTDTAIFGYTALEDLMRLSVADQHSVALHPTFRYWLQGMRRTAMGKAPDRHIQFLTELPSLLWGALASRGCLVRPMPVRTDLWGGIRCPSRGRYVEFGDGYANQTFEVRPRSGNDGVTFAAPDGLTVFVPLEDLTDVVPDPPPSVEEHGYRITLAKYLADRRIQVWARDPWLRVVLTGTMQRRDGADFFAVSEGSYSDRPPMDRLDAAFDRIRRHWPEEYEEIPCFSHVLVPADFGPNTTAAFTVSSRQGAIFIGDGSPDELVEMILHENAHVKLRQVQVLDTLLTDPLDEAVKVSVPWRPDPRPMPGVFEGVYVFAHVAEYHKRRARSLDPGASEIKLKELVKNLRHATSVLQAHAQLTVIGQQFLARVERWVDSVTQV